MAIAIRRGALPNQTDRKKSQKKRGRRLKTVKERLSRGKAKRNKKQCANRETWEGGDLPRKREKKKKASLW